MEINIHFEERELNNLALEEYEKTVLGSKLLQVERRNFKLFIDNYKRYGTVGKIRINKFNYPLRNFHEEVLKCFNDEFKGVNSLKFIKRINPQKALAEWQKCLDIE
jgi:hypothetical protein